MGHAYTLIGCAVHKGAKLILLRNPVENNLFCKFFFSGGQKSGKENGLTLKIFGQQNLERN